MTPSQIEEAIRRCAEEPIHRPGSVQPHGMLFALDTASGGIEQVSSNVGEFFGCPSEDLVGRQFLDLVEESGRIKVGELIRNAASTYVNPFRIPVVVGGKVEEFDGIAHLPNADTAIIELERNPSRKGRSSASDGLDEHLNLIQRTLARTAHMVGVEEVTDVMADEIRSFTGFDRVMIYRFAPDQHGEVIAERKARGLEPYLNLHYPASDIPVQARELYLQNPVRLLYDVDSGSAPLVPSTHPKHGSLDMSRSVLRSMSPLHLQYLRNMGVRSTLTVSLVIDGKLWGLIACHHRKPRYVPYAVRATACLFATVMSSQLAEKERLRTMRRAAGARREVLGILARMSGSHGLSGSLARVLPELATLFRADGAALLNNGEVRPWGSAPDPEKIAGAEAVLEKKVAAGWLVTDRARVDLPELGGASKSGAGLAAIHLGESMWLLLFRDELVQTVRWAGDPVESKSIGPDGTLNPRRSFAEWSETVEGCSRPWNSFTSDLITEVRSGLVGFIRKRNRMLEEANEELKNFAGVVAHEIKNQLHLGIMSLELAKERHGSADDPMLGEILESGSASLQSLSKFTAEMLSFAQLEAENESERVDLNSVVEEAVALLHSRYDPGDVIVTTLEMPTILASRVHLLHVLVNLLKNAAQHGKVGDRPLRIRIGARKNRRHGLVVHVRDDGRGVAESDLAKVFDYFHRDAKTGGNGIGLAFCSQLIRRTGHEIWVESKPGEGASFYFTATPA